MRLKLTSMVLALALILGAPAFLGGCDRNEGPLEEAGEALDDAMDDAADATGDAIDDATDAVDDALDR